MPHDLSRTANVKAEVMFVGEMPWHGLGTKLEKPPATAAEALRAARLEWKIEKKQLYIGEKRWPMHGQFALCV